MPEEAQSDDDRFKKAYTRRLREMRVEQQRREIIKKFVTTEAYERLMNVRMANHELYSQIVNMIIEMAQTNRVTEKITDEQMKNILTRLTYKPESTIEFKHK